MQTVLESARLRIRPVRIEDAPAILAAMDCPEIREMHSDQFHRVEDVESYIQVLLGEYERDLHQTWAIASKDTDALMGVLTVRKDPVFARAEIDYWMAIPYRGNGYTVEAVRALLPWCFDELGVRRVHAFVFLTNAASARVLEKAGFQYEGTLRAYIAIGDRIEDCKMYSILPADLAQEQ